jgi:hypothetical protein
MNDYDPIAMAHDQAVFAQRHADLEQALVRLGRINDSLGFELTRTRFELRRWRNGFYDEQRRADDFERALAHLTKRNQELQTHQAKRPTIAAWL